MLNAARADEKAQSYIDKGTYSGPCPVYLTYYLTPLAGTVQQVKGFPGRIDHAELYRFPVHGGVQYMVPFHQPVNCGIY